MDCDPQLHMAAYHDSSTAYNNDTLGVGALCVLDPDYRLTVGGYYNSLRRPSFYAAAAWQPLHWGTVRSGLLMGAVTGYQEGAIPLVASATTLTTGKIEWHLTLVPHVVDVSPATAELSVSYKFR